MPGVLGSAILGVDALGQFEVIEGALTPVIAVAPVPLAYAVEQTTTPQPRDLGIDQYGEFMLTPDGDLAFVSGLQRVAQDVWMLAMQPVGSNYGDPRIGSALAGLVGKRMPDQALLDGYANLLARQVTALQQRRIRDGDIPGVGEAIASVAASATKTGANTVTAPLVVRTQAGQVGETVVTL